MASKGKATLAAGMASFEHRLPADTSQADLEALVRRLNADPAVDGILVQLPLPAHLDDKAVIALIEKQLKWRATVKLPRSTKWLSSEERGLIKLLESGPRAAKLLTA